MRWSDYQKENYCGKPNYLAGYLIHHFDFIAVHK